MNNYIILLSIAFSFFFKPVSYSQGKTGKTDCYLQVEGVERHFIVYQPSTTHYKSLPVVFMFHGSSGNGERFYNISGWKEKSNKEGFIAVFPSALRYCVIEDGKQKNITKWNDGKLSSYVCQGQSLKDDVYFFKEMVRYLKSNYNIDEKRIYASGFSNGANFVCRLTIEASDVLAATAMSAGFLQDTTFVAKALISSFLTIGNMEKRLLEKYGKPLAADQGALADIDLKSIVYRMLDKLELKKEFTYQRSPGMALFRFDKNKGTASNIFQFGVIDSLDHHYPNGINHQLVMADIYWNYFIQFQK